MNAMYLGGRLELKRNFDQTASPCHVQLSHNEAPVRTFADTLTIGRVAFSLLAKAVPTRHHKLRENLKKWTYSYRSIFYVNYTFNSSAVDFRAPLVRVPSNQVQCSELMSVPHPAGRNATDSSNRWIRLAAFMPFFLLKRSRGISHKQVQMGLRC